MARPGFPAQRAARCGCRSSKSEYYPSAPLLPVGEITHDRLSVEIMRGCTRGCRFCQAGMINRPVREKPGAAGDRGGAARPQGDRPRGGLADLALDHRPHPDRRSGQRAGRRALPDAGADLAAVDAARQRPGRGRAPASRRRRRARSRSRPRRAASACATSSTRTTPRRSCSHSVAHRGARGLYQRQALLHVRSAGRERRRPARDPRPGDQGARARAKAEGNRGLPHHGQRLAARAQAAHAVRLGRAGHHRRAQPPARRCCARPRAASRSRSSTATPRRRCSRACSRAATAGWARRSRAPSDAAAASTPGANTCATTPGSRSFRELGIDPERYLVEHDTGARAAVGRRAVAGDAEVPGAREAPRRPRGDHRGLPARGHLLLVRCRRSARSDPWVKQPHATVDLDAARAQRRSPDGRGAMTRRRPSRRCRAPRERRRAASAPARASASCSRRAGDALHLASRPHARLGAHAAAVRGCRWRSRQGHHPHLKMSFGPPLPLGFRSRAEVFDLELSQPPVDRPRGAAERGAARGRPRDGLPADLCSRLPR